MLNIQFQKTIHTSNQLPKRTLLLVKENVIHRVMDSAAGSRPVLFACQDIRYQVANPPPPTPQEGYSYKKKNNYWDMFLKKACKDLFKR